MRIGLVCPYTWDVPGGVQVHIHELSAALIELGNDVSVISPADDDTPLPPYVTSVGRAVPVPYNGSVARLAFGPLSARRVRRWLRDGDFDVVHVHEPTTPSLSLLACWAFDGPLVATFHTSIERSRTLAAAYPILQTALEKISGRIAVSESARRTLVEHLGGDAVLIPNGVRIAGFADATPLPGWARSAAGGVAGNSLGFLGRLDEPRKGFPVLLQAFELLARERPDVRLLVAGPGDADDAVRGLPDSVASRVTFLGQVSDIDKARMLASVDLYVAPNIGGESFGIVLLEAMAAQTAVLASDLDAFRMVLDDGRSGALFPVGDAEALARRAGELLDDGSARARLVAAGRERVRGYEWSTVARDVVRVYETVAVDSATVVPHGRGFARSSPRGLPRQGG